MKGARTVANTLRPFDDVQLELDAAGSQARAHPVGAPGREIPPGGGADLPEGQHPVDAGVAESRRVRRASTRSTSARADAETKYYVQRTLRDFRLAGVDKDDATRKRIQALRDELVQIGQAFDRNIREDLRTVTAKNDARARRPSARLHRPPQAGRRRHDHAHHRLSRLAAGVLVREERGPAQADVHGIQQPRVSRRTSTCSTR